MPRTVNGTGHTGPSTVNGTKFFNALQSVGDDRAKELGEHSNYDQKCVVVP